MKNNLKKFIAAVLISALIMPTFAFAKSPALTIQEPTIAPLDQGSPAPWPGVLLNAAAVGSVKFDKDHEKEKIETAVQKTVSDMIAQKSGEIDMLKVSFNSSLSQKDALIEEKDGQLKVFQEENKVLRDDLSRSSNSVTWLGFGFVGGILVTIATAFAVSQASK